jgi:CheY-like chemotaxis protein/anti-sigma regulatory factor (Ser/Thr protein kinase)
VLDYRLLMAELGHELSRPLQAALNYTELALQDPGLSEAARSRLEMVIAEAERCREVLHRYLQAARPARPYEQTVDLNWVVERALEAAAGPVEAAQARVALRLADDLQPLVGDAVELEGVVRNLIENAADAVAEGGADRQVWVETSAVPGGIRLTVTDTGTGVSEGLEERVFEPFFTTKRDGSGTGLGLAIVRRVVREHGGEIRLERPAGGGTRMVVEWMADKVPAPPPPSPEREPVRETAASEPPSSPPSNGREALVVDDDASMRRLLAAYLEGFGYRTTEAADGREALAHSRARRYDLIICDVKMPVMSGAEYYRALHAEAPSQAERVVFATGVLPTDDDDGFLRALPNARLQKPFRLAALGQLLLQEA